MQSFQCVRCDTQASATRFSALHELANKARERSARNLPIGGLLKFGNFSENWDCLFAFDGSHRSFGALNVRAAWGHTWRT